MDAGECADRDDEIGDAGAGPKSSSGSSDDRPRRRDRDDGVDNETGPTGEAMQDGEHDLDQPFVRHPGAARRGPGKRIDFRDRMGT